MPPIKRTIQHIEGKGRVSIISRNRDATRREAASRSSATVASILESSSAISGASPEQTLPRDDPNAVVEVPPTSSSEEPSSTLAPVESRPLNDDSSNSTAVAQVRNEASGDHEVPRHDESGANASHNAGSQTISTENNVNNMYVYADTAGTIVQQPQFSRENQLAIDGRPAVYAAPVGDNTQYFYLATQPNAVQRPQFRSVPYVRNTYVNQNINRAYQPAFTEEYNNFLLVPNSNVLPYDQRSYSGCNCNLHMALNRQVITGSGFNYYPPPVQNSGYLYYQHVQHTPLVLCNCAIIVGNTNQLPGQQNNPNSNPSTSQFPGGQGPSSANQQQNNQNTE